MGKGKRVFVLRNRASTRRLLNQDAVAAALQDRFSFEIIDPAALSLAQQALAFRDADIVVGPHGAGLANMVFAARPSLLLEFYHSEPQIFYHSLCYALSARHQLVPGVPVTQGAKRGRADSADYVVDQNAVLFALDSFLGAPAKSSS